MSANETCGGCRWAATEGTFDRLPEDVRERARTSWCVCLLEDEWPLVMPKDTRPEEIPCDLWEAR